MALSQVQVAPYQNPVSSFATLTLPATAGLGNLIVVYVENSNSSSWTGSVIATDSAGTNLSGGSFTLVKGTAGTGYWLGIFAILAPAGTKKINVAWSAGNLGVCYAEEYSGNAAPLANCIDTSAGLSHASGTSTSGGGLATISPSAGTGLLVGAVTTTATNGTSSGTPPAWSGTPVLTLGLSWQNTTLFTGWLVTNTASAAPVGTWVTSRAWIEVTAYFKASFAGTTTQPASARISQVQTPTGQPTGARVAAPITAAQPAGAMIGSASTLTGTATESAGAVVSVTPTPTQLANAVLKVTATDGQPASAMVAGPPFSPLILMGPGNNLTEALGTSYFALSGDIDGGGPATPIRSGPATGALDLFTFVIDGGKSQ